MPRPVADARILQEEIAADDAEFEGAVNYLLKHKETAAQMARNGRRYVMEHFDWDVITRKYIELIRRMGGEGQEGQA